MRILPTAIPGCFHVQPELRADERGSFVKTFREDLFRAHGMATSFAEEYYSLSKPGVVRGLHFQLPPHEHAKLVYCVQGAVLDAALDLRRGSPTYGRHLAFELSAANGHMLYLPAGLAHGFCTLGEPAVMMYKVTSAYAPQHDSGIRWDSAGIAWPEEVRRAPLLSARDQGFATLAEFDSPFAYREKA